MPGKADIKAGRAYVELLLKNSAFVKGLRSSSRMLKDFGGGVARFGTGMLAAGGAITGVLAGMVSRFAATGSALNDMSARTGVAGSSLAEMGYAAEQTGASLEDVEAGIRKMQKSLAGSNKEFADLKGLSPEKQFEAIAERISAIPDPTKRAAKAMEIFGKSGTKLIPMMENLKELRQQARDKGLVPTDEAIAAADALGDGMDDVKKSISATVFEIGGALAPEVIKATKVVMRIVKASQDWIRDNQGLVKTVAMVGAGLVVAGGALVAIGTTIAVVGMALGGIATAISALGTVLAVVISGPGLLVAGLVAAVAAWAMFTESGKTAVDGIVGALTELLDIAKQTFGGIVDAISSGEFALAGQIAMAGLKVAFLQGVAAIASAVGGAFGDMIGNIGTMIAGGDFAGAWDVAVQGMAAVWDSFCSGITSAFVSAAKSIVDVWLEATTRISDLLLENADLIKTVMGMAGGVIGVKIGEAILGPTLSGDSLEEAKKMARGDLTGQAGEMKSALGEMNAAAAARAAQSMARVAGANDGGANAAKDAAALEQAKLDLLTAEAARLKALQDNQNETIKLNLPGATEQGATSKELFGTFSAAAASRQGGGGPMDKVAGKIDEGNKVLGRIEMRLMQNGKVR